MRSVIVVALGFAGLAAAQACGDRERVCNVDTDCSAGLLCVDGMCLPPASLVDAAPAEDAGGIAPQCASPGATCSVDSDCCSPPCASFVCGGGPGSSGASGSCQDLYAVCSSSLDCCSPYACFDGSCR